ncbi:hypothetical protein Pse7367_2528 [Thalassoporum mexicanum PCC 7367]|uniref:type II toxin-antitoxin system VapC family toxin n=1 Tax=Thalassoporum mexicanum TaxID=3457544 RepID=UPI00029FC6F9|nr:type II toxin-antitoxin system VapC family toxin [Pseudanabaena sp. PCC 7367]AFY70788.1 hypothetical protein Pse7367_2528 [Pseudanabaena sp. PCC 7367]
MILNTPIRCVVDANIAIKLFIDQPDSDKAKLIFSHLDSDINASLFVPGFFFVECTHVLLKYARNKDYKYSNKDAKEHLEALQLLRLQKSSTYGLVEDALNVGFDLGTSAYDSCYIVLANRLSVPLITIDGGLIKKTKNSLYQVYSLKDVEIPEPGK